MGRENDAERVKYGWGGGVWYGQENLTKGKQKSELRSHFNKSDYFVSSAL